MKHYNTNNYHFDVASLEMEYEERNVILTATLNELEYQLEKKN